MVAVAWILLRWDYNHGLLKIWLLGAGLFTGVSGLLYLVDWMRQMGKHPASLPGENESTTDGHG